MIVPRGPGAPRFPAVAHNRDPKLALQKPGKQFPNFPIIVHHQDMRHLFHLWIIGTVGWSEQGVLHSVAIRRHPGVGR